MSELEAWIKATLGKDANWPKREGTVLIPDQRTEDILSHYERECNRGRLTVVQAYERACNDIQGRNGHPSKPQHGRRYRAVTFNIIR